MAAASKSSENSGIFWISDGTTGISAKIDTRLRAGHRSNCKNEATLKTDCKKQDHLQSHRSGSYIKEKVAVHDIGGPATEHIHSSGLDAFLPSSQVISETSRAMNQVCLKDLCTEDKRRIANLIEELARVSEEKEESVQRLKDEQEQFELKIHQLEQQNLVIAHERESLQQQYKECQELLGLYQQYLSQQQAKLNQSIAQLSQVSAHTKVLSSEEAPNRASTNRVHGAVFDGSYLSLAATQANHPQAHRSGDGGRGAVQTCSNLAHLSSVSELSPTDRKIKQHQSSKRECREPDSCHRCKHCQGCGQNSAYGTQVQRIDNGSSLESGCHDTFNQPEFNRNAMSSGAKITLTGPLLGHEDWEEKRHQLLLQKMQLEGERERLQARLTEQEERLNRQNKQLHQSHLDVSRFQQATQAEPSKSETRSCDRQLDYPSHQDLPSSVHEDTVIHPDEDCLHQNYSQPAPAPLENSVHACEALQQSRRDMATSPAKSPASLNKPTSSVIQKTPDARLDFSLVELLDIFSPVSVPEQSKLSTRRSKTTQCRPAFTTSKPLGRALLTPAGYSEGKSQQDLEESQILEDIFFIC
ncbi:protein hinderin isoform X2 [Mastacembelus armatus]|uniref:Zgc:162344 n=1 Tax=Mastacembelus armatus TaxID=205130 RepID=A0A3Q3SNA1_9TELE|nr:protein hinderin isoform X2 [Mastacembelus armatus]